MPIKVICEKRHHLGESDIFYPAVFCDVCGKRIADGNMANYCYTVDYDCTKDEFYEKQHDIYYIHVECSAKLTGFMQHNGWKPVPIDNGKAIVSSEVFFKSWGRLKDFALWLGRNMGVALTEIEETPQLKQLLSGMQQALNWTNSNCWEGSADELACMVYEVTGGNCDVDAKELVKLLRSSKPSLTLRGYDVAISGKPSEYFLKVSRQAS